MQIKNRQKKFSIIVTLVFLMNLLTPLTAPLTALAETSDDPEIEVVEAEVEADDPAEVEPAADDPAEVEPAADDPVEGEPEGDEPVVTSLGLGSDEDGISTAQVSPENFELSILHMNDTHARVDNYARMVTAIDENREDNSLLLHAGDVFSGTLYFNEFQGQADLALMNLMGIDAMVFGNHEFDLGNSPEGHQALANFVSEANFPFLGTNVDFSNDPVMAPLETNESVVEMPDPSQIYDSIVLDVDGEKVGVFGLVTEDTVNIASPMSVAFNNYIAAAREAVEEFEAEDINKIVALTHIGHASAPDVGNDLILAGEVDGIDIIVGGHSHTRVSTPVVTNEDSAPTVIVQGGANAEFLGSLNVEFDNNGEIIVDEITGELIPVLPDRDDPSVGYAEDSEALTVLAEYKNHVDAINNEEIGAEAVIELENPRSDDGGYSVRANETPLGNLVTDAMLAKTQELYPETVIAFQNGGGIRERIDAGPITVGEVIEVLPFGNNPVVVELSGQEIKDILEISLGEAPRENGGFLQTSGLEVYYDSQRDSDRVVAMFVEQNGELTEIQLGESYLVTTNAFTGGGGDGLTPFEVAYNDGRVQDTGAIDWEQLRDYMIEEEYLNGVVDPVVEGRINDLEGQDYVDYQITRLSNRIAELEEELAAFETQNTDLIAEINALRDLLAELQSDIEAGESAVSELEQRIAELEARVAELEEEPATEEEPTPDTDADTDTDNEETSVDETPSEESSSEDALPATGSSVVIPLVSGATLVISGLGLEMYRKKKYKI